MVNYRLHFLNEATTDILFVGYQAQGTLGRDIQRYGPRGGYVFIDGIKTDINAKIHTISGYSAHADQSNLVNFVTRIRHKSEKVIIVHGDDEVKIAFAEKLKQQGLQAIVGGNYV